MIEVLPGDATAFLLLFARLGALLMSVPLFSEDAVPGRVRLLMTLGMTAGLWGLLGPTMPRLVGDEPRLAAMLVTELLLGLAIGMLIRMMFMAITIAGGIISLQIGLTSALLFDASAGGQVPVLSKLMNIAAVLVCMGLGVHHLWIATLVHSYSLFPVGTLPPAKDFLDLAIMTAGRTMAIGLGLSAPLVIYGLVFNMALGLASRLAPAIQIFFIAQPLNLLGGIALLMLLIGSMLAAFANSLSAWTMAIWG